MEQETSTLTLSTSDITIGFFTNNPVDNQYGRIENNRCTFTWKNINMMQLLGEMYDKYETFNIYLYQISQAGSSATAITAQSALVDIRMSGLPFINQVSKNNLNSAYITSYLLMTGNSNAVGQFTPMYNPPILSFGKSSDNVNITIDMKCTKDQQYPTVASPATSMLGHFVFMFKFYGIPTRTNNLITNGVRM